MAGAHHLLGLSFATVGRAPQRPVFRPGDGCAGIPELGADPAIAGVLEHADALAPADFPTDLTTELEVVALVIDRPALVGLHVDGAVRAAEDIVEGLRARFQADIGHPNERDSRPAVGAHCAVRAALADYRRCLARGHVAGEEPASDDVELLR